MNKTTLRWLPGLLLLGAIGLALVFRDQIDVAARNLPLEELANRLEELEPHLERPIALICRTDRRSAQAASILARAGFVDVHVVRDGMTAWLANG